MRASLLPGLRWSFLALVLLTATRMLAGDPVVGDAKSPQPGAVRGDLAAACIGAESLAQEGAPEPGNMANRRTPEVIAAQNARPAVVYIETDQLVNARNSWGFQQLQPTRSSGSGVVIFDDGFVVTNYHVVRAATRITVRFDQELDPTIYEARVISQVESEDLALLKIERKEPFPTIPMGTSSDLMIAEPVLAIGNPFGQTQTVSRGIVSGLHRNVTVDNLQFLGLIQTDASINPGNSGGALININGELIGINTVMNARAENIGFAIPVDRVREVLEKSLLSPTQALAWFGYELDNSDGALRVNQVLDDSPASRAGLEPGDLVLALAGRSLAGIDEYNRQRLAIAPNEKVALAVERGGARLDLELTSWDRVDGFLFERAGIRVQAVVVSDGARRLPMLLVADVRREGPGSRLGLEPGDFLEALQASGRRPFQPRTPLDLAYYISRLPKLSVLDLDIWRDLDQNGRLEGDAQRSELLRGSLELE